MDTQPYLDGRREPPIDGRQTVEGAMKWRLNNERCQRGDSDDLDCVNGST
jgi:hypothetical protein